MKNTLIIGDIHGCFYELQALLDKAGMSDGDEVIVIGDIVDRGPETPQVVDFFQTTPNTMAIMGNHERKHARAARLEVKLSISQQICQVQFGPAYQKALEWMSALPLYIELEHAIVVHGYFEPGIPLEKQNPSVLCGTMGGDHLLRKRYDRPWYELYDVDILPVRSLLTSCQNRSEITCWMMLRQHGPGKSFHDIPPDSWDFIPVRTGNVFGNIRVWGSNLSQKASWIDGNPGIVH